MSLRVPDSRALSVHALAQGYLATLACAAAHCAGWETVQHERWYNRVASVKLSCVVAQMEAQEVQETSRVLLRGKVASSVPF